MELYIEQFIQVYSSMRGEQILLMSVQEKLPLVTWVNQTWDPSELFTIVQTFWRGLICLLHMSDVCKDGSFNIKTSLPILVKYLQQSSGDIQMISKSLKWFLGCSFQVLFTKWILL